MKNSVKIEGFTRLELVDVRGKHKGRRQLTNAGKNDGWTKNVVTANGFSEYIVKNIGSNLTGTKIAFHQVASQTDAPVSSQESATGEFEARKSTSNSFVANGTLRATCSFATNEATQSNLGAVAQYNTSSGGTAASVATFTTSAKTTDQELRITYDWRFS